MTAMLLVVFGRSGQLARELARTQLPSGWRMRFLARPEVDFSGSAFNPGAVLDHAMREASAAIVINAAGYTAVDRAESEPGVCYAVNAEAPRCLADACAARDLPLIHISTDYVFDGRKAAPYYEDDAADPLNVYGASKLAGEHAIRAATPAHVIVRTQWVYSPFGANFVKTMLRLGRDRETLSVVDDQFGCPTSAGELARAVVSIAEQLGCGKADGYGVFHLSGEGWCAWLDFARTVFEAAARHGRPVPNLMAVRSADYPTAARRPANARLDCSRIRNVYGISGRPWRLSVRNCVDELLRARQPA